MQYNFHELHSSAFSAKLYNHMSHSKYIFDYSSTPFCKVGSLKCEPAICRRISHSRVGLQEISISILCLDFFNNAMLPPVDISRSKSLEKWDFMNVARPHFLEKPWSCVCPLFKKGKEPGGITPLTPLKMTPTLAQSTIGTRHKFL